MVSDDRFDNLNLDRNKADITELLGNNKEQEPPAEAPEPVEPFTAGEGFKHAFRYETLTGFGVRSAIEPEFEPDPNLNLTMGYFDENYNDIPREFHDFLYEGESIPEIEYRAQWLRQRMADQERFDAMPPAEQIGLLLSATLADAPSLAASALAGVVTEGAGTAVAGGRLGLTGMRILRVLGAGAGAATEAAIQEAILASRDPLKNDKTVALAALMGFGFGAVGGEIGNRIASSRIRNAAAKDADALRDTLIKDAADELYGTKPVSPVDAVESTTANVTPGEGELSALDKIYQGVDDEPGVLNKVGIDLTSQLKRSADPEIRKLGSIMGEDGIYGGGPTMALEFDTTTRPIIADAMRDMNEAYKGWAKDSGINLVGRVGHQGRLEFNSKVASIVRGADEPATHAEAQAARSVQKFFKDMLGVAKKSGVRGFENIEENIQYLTRYYSQQNFQKAISQLGDIAPDVIRRTIKGAITSGQNEFDDAVADAIAKGIYNRTVKMELASDDRFTTVLTQNFKQDMEGILKDADLSADEIEKIVGKLTEKSDNGMDVTKHRINMNEGWADPESGLKFTDLLENNTEQLMVRYARSVGGASAAAKFGFKTPQDLINHINKTANTAFREGRLTEAQAKAIRRKATTLANEVLGRPNEEFDTFHRVAQVLMDYEYIRSSGGFSLASMPEMLIAAAENGFTATLKHVPMLNKFIGDIRNGIEPDKDIMKLLEGWGVGRDMDMTNAFVRIAEDDALNATVTKGMNVLNTSKRIASIASGLPQLTRFSQLIAGKSTIQNFVDLAYKDSPVKMRQWLSQLGFQNEQQLNNVFAGLKKHAISQKGLSGRKVIGLDYSAWMKEDPAAATQFMYAVARKVNHQIQRNLPGELPEFMSKTVGKLVAQFQTFGIAAYGKKTLNAMARRDVESAVAIAYTTAAAAMVYAGRMWVIAQAKDDPEAFLEERLSPSNLVKAAITRNGYASILPSMIDNGIALTKPWHGQERIFNDYARTSGLSVGGAESIPALQTGVNLVNAGSLVRKTITGDPVEEKDVRAATNIMPFRRLPGINYLYETLINQFPEKGEEQ